MEDENGIENVLKSTGLSLPEVYSADLSVFVMKAGVKIFRRYRPDFMYLSLSDFIQHKYAPGAPESDDFYREIDLSAGELADMGAVVGITADHGMNDKSSPDGTPEAIYLQDLLDGEFGSGAVRVILPITDPYVVHHGSLGGFARIYCQDLTRLKPVRVFVEDIPGVEAVYEKASACEIFELPEDREADLVVIGDAKTVIGSTESKHDLSKLGGFRLRSHGGTSEQRVPFILSQPLNDIYMRRSVSGTLHNYDMFDFAVNGVSV